MKFNLYFIFILLLMQSCVNNENDIDKHPLAKVNDEYLYYEDVVSQIPEKYIESDSAKLINSIVENWVTEKLMFIKAEKNLKSEQLEIDRQVENYRNTLLVYKYQQNYLNQNLDTNITSAQLQEYYNEFSHDFKLEFEIIKGLFIKISSKNPDIYKVRNWYRSTDEDKARKLDALCNMNAEIYEDFNGEWTNFIKLSTQLPFNFTNNESFLKYNKSYESRDSLYTYFLNITDYKLKNDTTPLIFIEDNIKKIIINKRKIQIIKELEMNIYQDAQNSKQVVIY